MVPLLAETLGVPPSFFFRSGIELGTTPAFFRSRVSASKGSRLGSAARLEWLLEIVTELERHVELPEITLPDLSINPRTANNADVDAAAVAARLAFGLGEGPVQNMVALLESRGVVVSRAPLAEGKLDAFSAWHPSRRPVVFLNADKRAAVRSRFDAAHELAHLLLHRSTVPADFLEDKELFTLIEKQADRFAGTFLVPEDALRREVHAVSLEGLLALKPRWGTSVASLLYRSQTLGLLEASAAQWQWILLARRGWKSGEPLDDVLPIEVPSVLRQAFDVLREASLFPKHEMVVPVRDVEALCALPVGYLDPPSLTPRVVLKSKEVPPQSS